MIQELLGGVVEERNISTFNLPSFSTSSLSSPSQSAASSPSNSSAAAAAAEPQQNLWCPRCDSNNTKFCYYNNYNLTQPRHFCKTCRRYWTKGGALRNVPIGGGCRKAKASAPTIIASKSAGGGNPRSLASPLDVMGRVVGLDHGCPELLPSSPILWTGMPHSSHLLALLRASQMQNPNPNPNPNHHNHGLGLLNSFKIKEEAATAFGGAQMLSDVHSLSLDHAGQLPIGTCNSSLWKNNENHLFQYHQQLPQAQHLQLGEVPTSSGIQELYQRLRSTTTSNNAFCNNEHLQSISNNVGTVSACSSSAATTTMATTTTASLMEPIPLTGGEFGYWNPAMSWPDLSAMNGAFH